MPGKGVSGVDGRDGRSLIGGAVPGGVGHKDDRAVVDQGDVHGVRADSDGCDDVAHGCLGPLREPEREERVGSPVGHPGDGASTRQCHPDRVAPGGNGAEDGSAGVALGLGDVHCSQLPVAFNRRPRLRDDIQPSGRQVQGYAGRARPYRYAPDLVGRPWQPGGPQELAEVVHRYVPRDFFRHEGVGAVYDDLVVSSATEGTWASNTGPELLSNAAVLRVSRPPR